MKTFKDSENREWSIGVNVSTIKRTRSLLGIDLYAIADEEFSIFEKIMSDPILLCDILYCLVKDEADRRGITDEDFGRAMSGDAIYNAQQALVDEIIDFFPDRRIRAAVQKMKEAHAILAEKLAKRAQLNIDNLDLDSVVNKLSASSTNLQELLESIPIR